MKISNVHQPEKGECQESVFLLPGTRSCLGLKIEQTFSPAARRALRGAGSGNSWHSRSWSSTHCHRAGPAGSSHSWPVQAGPCSPCWSPRVGQLVLQNNRRRRWEGRRLGVSPPVSHASRECSTALWLPGSRKKCASSLSSLPTFARLHQRYHFVGIALTGSGFPTSPVHGLSPVQTPKYFPPTLLSSSPSYWSLKSSLSHWMGVGRAQTRALSGADKSCLLACF